MTPEKKKRCLEIIRLKGRDCLKVMRYDFMSKESNDRMNKKFLRHIGANEEEIAKMGLD